LKTLFKTIILSVLSILFINSPLFSQGTVNEHSIKFLNQSMASLVGEDGVILNTIDGGLNWTALESGVTNVLYGNAIVDENTSFVVGENGLILKTSDGGNSWNIIPSGTFQNLKKVMVIDSSVIICGEQGVMMVSHDMGATWANPVKFTNRNLNYITFTSPAVKKNNIKRTNKRALSGFILYAVGDSSGIFNSTDDGDSWSQIPYSNTSLNFESIAAIDQNNLTLVGDSYTIVRTNDGGITWTTPGYTPGSVNLNEITFFDANNGVIVGDDGLVLNTTDAGNTWLPSNVQVNPAIITQKDLKSVAFSSVSNGIAIGQDGAQYYSTDGGQNWTMQLSTPANKNKAKKNLQVAVKQNFPNPFNPSTIISYNLPFDASVTLKVYDMLGKQVTSLVNGNQSAGSYNFRFDGANLSSGIYFYELKATGNNVNFSKTMRMILTK
jgi:photosystem II stability/assembly factor-like uncharacterized protein